MKTGTCALIVATLVLTAGVQRLNAQSYFSDVVSCQAADLKKAEKNYLACLDSPNDGVLESGLAHIAMMKIFFPASAFPTLEQKVAELSVAGRTPTIRYKAYLTSAVFENPTAFALVAMAGYEDGEQLFKSLAAQMQVQLLGSR